MQLKRACSICYIVIQHMWSILSTTIRYTQATDMFGLRNHGVFCQSPAPPFSVSSFQCTSSATSSYRNNLQQFGKNLEIRDMGNSFISSIADAGQRKHLLIPKLDPPARGQSLILRNRYNVFALFFQCLFHQPFPCVFRKLIVKSFLNFSLCSFCASSIVFHFSQLSKLPRSCHQQGSLTLGQASH